MMLFVYFFYDIIVHLIFFLTDKNSWFLVFSTSTGALQSSSSEPLENYQENKHVGLFHLSFRLMPLNFIERGFCHRCLLPFVYYLQFPGYLYYNTYQKIKITCKIAAWTQWFRFLQIQAQLSRLYIPNVFLWSGYWIKKSLPSPPSFTK